MRSQRRAGIVFDYEMGRPRAAPLLVRALAVLLVGCGGSSSHSLRFFYTGVSEPGHGLPRFIAVGYVDDQLINQYDSDVRMTQPRAPWMEKVVEDDPQYWKRQTEIIRGTEDVFRANLDTARNYYNQSRGFHSLQQMYGCELRPDGSIGGHFQWAYDGRDYLSFDKDSLTWTAIDPPAQNTKRKWEAIQGEAQRRKAYLEEICIEWLQRYLEYGKQRLLRTERPEGKVTHKEGYDDRETLVCQAYGFYPKEIDVTWRKDGEVLHEGTFRRNVAPYPDGTYHAWLSIDIDPKDRDQYRCHVDHASLGEPLVLAWEEEPGANVGLIVGCVALALLLIASVLVGAYFCMKNRGGYNKASTTDKSSTSSSEGTNPAV